MVLPEGAQTLARFHGGVYCREGAHTTFFARKRLRAFMASYRPSAGRLVIDRNCYRVKPLLGGG